MKIGALKESYEGEARVAVTPSSAAHLKKLGHEVFVESGAGVRAGFSDAAYQAAGVTVEPTAAALINDVDVVVKVRPPEMAEIAQMRRGQTLISHFWPAQNAELLEAAREQGITPSPWTWCRASRARKRWTRSARWRTSPAIAR